jgi:hypothetical protein
MAKKGKKGKKKGKGEDVSGEGGASNVKAIPEEPLTVAESILSFQ